MNRFNVLAIPFLLRKRNDNYFRMNKQGKKNLIRSGKRNAGLTKRIKSGKRILGTFMLTTMVITQIKLKVE